MSFASDLKTFARETKHTVNETKRVVCIKLFSAVVLDTPVDTGRARGNWLCSLNAPRPEIVAERKKGEVFTEIESIVGPISGDDTAYLRNNLDYIAGLENGSSKQAPQGMMRRNVMRFTRLINSELARLRK
jgi:hypothetical protein